MCSLNAFIVVQLIQSCDKEFHLSTIRLLKVYFLLSSLLGFLNNFLECPLLPPLSNSKNNPLSTLSTPLMILQVCIKSLLTLVVVSLDNP